MQPQLCVQARQFLKTARLTEYLIHALFRPASEAETAVSRTLRTSQERVRKVKEALLEQLDAPPSLDELAVIAGCAAFHLSRTFMQVEGLTLSNWLRRARIEKAAYLIATRRVESLRQPQPLTTFNSTASSSDTRSASSSSRRGRLV